MIAAALRSALTREPGIFAPVAGHAATETALERELAKTNLADILALVEKTCGQSRKTPH